MNFGFETRLNLIEAKITDNKGNLYIQKYVKGKLLGKGGFAKCFEFKNFVTGEVFAAKVINKISLVKGRSRIRLDSEIRIHQSLNHFGIVKFQNSFEDANNIYMLDRKSVV